MSNAEQPTTACRLTGTKDKSEEEVSSADQNRGNSLAENTTGKPAEQISSTNEIHSRSRNNNNVPPKVSSCRGGQSVEAKSAIVETVPSKISPGKSTTTTSSRNQATEYCGDPRQEDGEIEEEVTEGQSSAVVELMRSNNNNNKRRMAPKPPPADFVEELFLPPSTSSLFARNPGANFKSDSPVVREKEKRERASSCSPKFRKAVSELPDPTVAAAQTAAIVHDPTSRRSISLSQDNLTSGQSEVREEKKRGRPRFSLKRFLRMGSRKDVDMVGGGHGSSSRIDEIPSTPQPKPRLEIIHPLELDGAAVEVVGNDRVGRIAEDQPDSCVSPRNDAARASRSPLSNGSHAGESLSLSIRFINRWKSPCFDTINILEKTRE